MSSVLDASALLALVNDEPGAVAVRDAIALGASMSAVNYSEVVARLADRGADAESVRATLGAIEVRVVPFDVDSAHWTGMLRPATRQAGLSLGDRACLSLAMQLDMPAMTGDRVWRSLDVGVPIVVFR